MSVRTSADLFSLLKPTDGFLDSMRQQNLSVGNAPNLGHQARANVARKPAIVPATFVLPPLNS